MLLEHVWVALGAVALLRWAAGAPVLPGLDVLAVGLCPFLACGRLGCVTVGCCHGQPGHARRRLPGRRRAARPARRGPPVPGAAGRGGGAGRHRRGRLRAGRRAGGGGDGVGAGRVRDGSGSAPRRCAATAGPRLRGVSVARLMCAVQLAAAPLALGELVAPGLDLRRGTVEVGVLALAGSPARCWPGVAADPLAAPEQLDELWARIRS